MDGFSLLVLLSCFCSFDPIFLFLQTFLSFSLVQSVSCFGSVSGTVQGFLRSLWLANHASVHYDDNSASWTSQAGAAGQQHRLPPKSVSALQSPIHIALPFCPVLFLASHCYFPFSRSLPCCWLPSPLLLLSLSVASAWLVGVPLFAPSSWTRWFLSTTINPNHCPPVRAFVSQYPCECRMSIGHTSHLLAPAYPRSFVLRALV